VHDRRPRKKFSCELRNQNSLTSLSLFNLSGVLRLRVGFASPALRMTEVFVCSVTLSEGIVHDPAAEGPGKRARPAASKEILLRTSQSKFPDESIVAYDSPGSFDSGSASPPLRSG
jgi:hypothetical protein